MTLHRFVPRGAREHLVAALFRLSLKALLKPAFSPRWTIDAQRARLRRLAGTTALPRGVRYEAAVLGGVAGEWIRPPDAADVDTSPCVLYLHGGAYCIGSPITHRNLTARLAQALGLPVFAADYRLAPEHPHPAALNDALAAARALLGRRPVIIAGDSAGGGLALATAIALRDEDAPGPAALVLLSPWVDLTLREAPLQAPAGEVMLSVEWAAACAAHYLADTPAQAPQVSPLFADLHGLPPTLIQAGTDELLHDEAIRLHDRLESAGVAVRCDITTGRWHVFQIQAGLLPSANEAIARVAHFVGEQLARAPLGTAPRSDARIRYETVILGAGMSGLCMGIQLKQAGRHDFVMLEKSAGLGGTWWDNSYPGAQVDVPAPLYSFSFEPNPQWARRFATAAQIQAYMQHCADKYRIRPHLRLGRRISAARFDDTAGEWLIDVEGGEKLAARYFICSTGPLSQAKFPDIPGLSEFRGTLLHSARWDHSADLEGKRVAVIGTGSTAAQLIPPIAARAARLHVFQRTANWVLPRLDRRYTALDRALAHVPPYAALVRRFWYGVLELGRRGFDEGTLARRSMLANARRLLQRQVRDPALRAQLTPPYPLGCKRIIYSNDYYPALVRPNTELVTTGIERITRDGILTSDGQERPIDALVCATGFDTVHLLSSVSVTGLNGRSLREAWRDGPAAYHGMTVPGFPNLFLLLGPNTATGHTSTLLFIEPEVQYAIACMDELESRGQRWLSLREEAFEQHNRALQDRLKTSVWASCRSWYRMENGKVVALFPGFTHEYVEAIGRPDWRDYQFM